MPAPEDSMRGVGPTTLQIPRRKTIHQANPTRIQQWDFVHTQYIQHIIQWHTLASWPTPLHPSQTEL
jgi:hypothetical protein